MTIEELQVLITANTNDLKKEIGKTNKDIQGLQKQTTKSSTAMLGGFKTLANGIVALGIGKIIKDSIVGSMNAIESENLFSVSLGNMAGEVTEWSKTMSNALGLNEYEMRKNVGTLYNMSSSMGIAGDNALIMSKGLTMLSQDMASFYNLSGEDAMAKLQAGITGETEPLKRLGILIDENTIKQTAYQHGIAQTGSELTEQQKVMARYVAIMNQTSNAQGDLARTVNSPTNQIRMLKSQIQQVSIAFGNLFIPVLNAVLPYITAFAKVVATALQGLGKLLGLVGGGSTSSMATDMGNVAVGTGDVASGLDKANASAKKLKGSLAGFDEMNVLSDPKESGGSSGGGASVGGGVDFDLSEYDAGLDGIESKTDEIIKNIQNSFSNLDFTKTINSLERFREVLTPITSKIFDGLKWGWDNVLVPLGEWTITQLLPQFLDLISGSLELLNPLLTSFQILGEWLWKNFLQPIATWTGSAIVTILDGMNNGLTAFSTWAGENQEIVNNMVVALSTFFGLWKLTELMAFISMSGGLIKAIQGITGALWLSVSAKIADKLQTIALTAMYAKDFIISIISGTGAIIKQIAQFVILTGLKLADMIQTGLLTATTIAFNVAIGIANVVGGIFAGIMTILTSPITLVILAIAGVITAGIMLYKNWETIMSWAGKLGDKIKEVFGTIGNWFADTFSGVWDTIKSFINLITGGINTLIKGVNKVKFNIPDWVPAIGGKKFGFNIPQIPKLARGGIVDKPTTALIGEAGTEAVVPLENNTGWLDKMAGMITDKLGGFEGGQPINLIVKIGDDTIFKKFYDYQELRQFMTNGEVVL